MDLSDFGTKLFNCRHRKKRKLDMSTRKIEANDTIKSVYKNCLYSWMEQHLTIGQVISEVSKELLCLHLIFSECFKHVMLFQDQRQWVETGAQKCCPHSSAIRLTVRRLTLSKSFLRVASFTFNFNERYKNVMLFQDQRHWVETGAQKSCPHSSATRLTAGRLTLWNASHRPSSISSSSATCQLRWEDCAAL